MRHVESGVIALAVRRHVLHVRFPCEAGAFESVHDVRRVPGGPRARIRVRQAVVAGAPEIASSREREVVRQAGVRHGRIVPREAGGVRQRRHVGRGAVAGRQDLAEAVVLQDDRDEVVEVLPGRRRGGGATGPGNDIETDPGRPHVSRLGRGLGGRTFGRSWRHDELEMRGSMGVEGHSRDGTGMRRHIQWGEHREERSEDQQHRGNGLR